MKSGKRFISLALFGTLVLYLVAALPVFSDTGALRFYDPSDADAEQTWTRQGGQIGIELTDPDLSGIRAGVVKHVNIPGGTPDECEDCALAEVVTLNDQITFGLKNIPVVDRNDDGFVNSRDVNVFETDGTELTVDRASVDGRVDLVVPYTGTVYVRYWGARRHNTGDAVRIKSQADPMGFTTTLEETTPTSGVFRLVISVRVRNSDPDSDPPRLKVGQDDVITLSYMDSDPSGAITKKLNVETTSPVFSNIIPAHGFSSRADPEVEFDVTDARSGVTDENRVWVIFAVDKDDDGIIEEAREYRVNGAPRGHIDSIDHGFQVRMGLPRSFDIGSDATIYWWALGQDAAGNLGILDRSRPADDTFHPCFPYDFPREDLGGTDVTAAIHVGGCLPYTTRIDNTGPTIKRVVTGRWWDLSKSGEDKTEYDSTKAKNTSILVAFSEDMDSSTVQNTDFLVDGEVPMKAEVFNGRLDYVFLTVSPLSAGAQPEVETQGSILDVAGNHLVSGETDENGDSPDPDPPTMKDSFDLLVSVLRESEVAGTYSDEMGDLLADLFIEYLIVPVSQETADEVETRIMASDSALSNNSLDYLIAVVDDARRLEALSDALADLLSDLFIEYLIIPATGETVDEAKDRLSAQ